MRTGTTLLVALVAAAGCLGAGEESATPGDSVVFDSALVVRGLVLDVELVPVEGAHVYLDDGEPASTSANDGTFELRPGSPGLHTVTAERAGYATATQDVRVDEGAPAHVTIELTPAATDVPYFETQVFASTIGCAVSSAVRLTCGLVNQVSGTSSLPDESVFPFAIPQEGLATLVVESAWKAGTAFANELSVNILDVEGDQTNCVTTKCYSEAFGPSPVRFRLTPGESYAQADITYEPFPGDVGHAFNTYLMPPFGTASNPLMVFADQRVDSHFTFFYNRAASDAFTALPEA